MHTWPFWTTVFLIGLRLAIGWHFVYEGASKLETYLDADRGVRPWSAEPFLATASGPCAPYYRAWLLDDPDGIERVTVPDDGSLPEHLRRAWQQSVDDFVEHYGLDERRRQQAQQALEEVSKDTQQWLHSQRAYIAHYLQSVRHVRQQELAALPPFERQRLYSEYLRGLLQQRSYLLGYLQAREADLQRKLDNLLDASQRQWPNPKPSLTEWHRWREWLRKWHALDWVNASTVYGLLAMGLGLMLGLFTRLAALAAVLFLLSVYLAMPPWPGLPGTSAWGGHYLYVNYQLIEALAVLACAGTGRIAGVDALLRALFRRKQRAPAPDSTATR
ncbi:MAG: hypothetical protein C4297_06120 [Gemmataceae bacterium]